MGKLRENWDNLSDPRMVAFISVAVMGTLMAGAAIFGFGYVIGGGGGKATPPPPADAKKKK
jgi:hypothetical protein